jgi:hypothetical protein
MELNSRKAEVKCFTDMAGRKCHISERVRWCQRLEFHEREGRENEDGKMPRAVGAKTVH